MEDATGVIRVVSSLNDIDQTKYSLGVDVTDGTHLTTSKIDIIIVPENSEETFESASYSFEVEVRPKAKKRKTSVRQIKYEIIISHSFIALCFSVETV